MTQQALGLKASGESRAALRIPSIAALPSIGGY